MTRATNRKQSVPRARATASREKQRERALREQIYELAPRLVPARGTLVSQHISLYRTYLSKHAWRYTAALGVAFTVPRARALRAAFCKADGIELTTRVKALAALVAKLTALPPTPARGVPRR